jgi:hypothetical protein
LVERSSRFTVLVPVDAPRRADSLRDALVPALSVLPAELRKSIAWDQGWAMAGLDEITKATGAHIYFCEPNPPWQRGTNSARGIAFGIVGSLFVWAAVTHDADKSGGLDQALSRLLHTPLGPVLLAAVAAGFACYGTFNVAKARHHDS